MGIVHKGKRKNQQSNNETSKQETGGSVAGGYSPLTFEKHLCAPIKHGKDSCVHRMYLAILYQTTCCKVKHSFGAREKRLDRALKLDL